MRLQFIQMNNFPHSAIEWVNLHIDSFSSLENVLEISAPIFLALIINSLLWCSKCFGRTWACPFWKHKVTHVERRKCVGYFIRIIPCMYAQICCKFEKFRIIYDFSIQITYLSGLHRLNSRHKFWTSISTRHFYALFCFGWWGWWRVIRGVVSVCPGIRNCSLPSLWLLLLRRSVSPASNHWESGSCAITAPHYSIILKNTME